MPKRTQRSVGPEMYRTVLGKKSPKSPEGIREFTINHLFANVWSRDGLTIRERRLMTIAILAAQGHHDQLVKHVEGVRSGNETEATSHQHRGWVPEF